MIYYKAMQKHMKKNINIFNSILKIPLTLTGHADGLRVKQVFFSHFWMLIIQIDLTHTRHADTSLIF